MLTNLTFVVKFAHFSIRSEKILLFRAIFEQLFEKLRKIFLENLEQLVESPNCNGLVTAPER